MVATILCPSLGYMSVGRLASGMVGNALVVAVQTALLVATAYFHVFPGTTLILAAVAWLALTVMMGLEVMLDVPDDESSPGYHWTTSVAAALLTYALPLTLLVAVAGSNLYAVVSVDNDAMYPTLQAGDQVLVSKNFAASEPLGRGRLATVRTRKHGLRILRVVALPGQSFSMAGRQITVDESDVPAAPVDADVVGRQLDGRMLGGFGYWLEGPAQNRYIVSYAEVGDADLLVPARRMGEESWFGLTDNRSQRETDRGSGRIVDSRQLGAFGIDQVIGRPAFVAWSVEPNTGHIDWERTWARLGLRLQ